MPVGDLRGRRPAGDGTSHHLLISVAGRCSIRPGGRLRAGGCIGERGRGCRSCRCLSRFLSRARVCGLRRGRSPASRRPREPGLTAVAAAILSCPAVRSRRIRQRVIRVERPRCPRVSFWVRRRTSSRRWLARRIVDGSATCTACGNTLSYAFLMANRTCPPPPSGYPEANPPVVDRNQAAALSGCSTTDYVDQAGRGRQRDDSGAPLLRTPTARRQQRLVHSATASTVPTRSVSASNRASPQRPCLFVHRMPITTQLGGDLLDRTAPPTHWMTSHRERSRCQPIHQSWGLGR